MALPENATITWRVLNLPALQVSATGVVTARDQVGEAVVGVQVSMSNFVSGTGREVVVTPAGTYRVRGTVVDAESTTAPIAGATVEVTSGDAVRTDTTGAFRFYGVPADVQLRVVAEGYQTITCDLHPDRPQDRDDPTFACWPARELGRRLRAVDRPGLLLVRPADSDGAHVARYDATIVQNGPLLEVSRTEPRFKINKTGRGTAASTYPSVAEVSQDGQSFVVWGNVEVTRSGNGLSGLLAGSMSVYGNGFPGPTAELLGFCASRSIDFRLTPR